jgi:hypothetical protein
MPKRKPDRSRATFLKSGQAACGRVLLAYNPLSGSRSSVYTKKNTPAAHCNARCRRSLLVPGLVPLFLFLFLSHSSVEGKGGYSVMFVWSHTAHC